MVYRGAVVGVGWICLRVSVATSSSAGVLGGVVAVLTLGIAASVVFFTYVRIVASLTRRPVCCCRAFGWVRGEFVSPRPRGPLASRCPSSSSLGAVPVPLFSVYCKTSRFCWGASCLSVSHGQGRPCCVLSAISYLFVVVGPTWSFLAPAFGPPCSSGIGSWPPFRRIFPVKQ